MTFARYFPAYHPRKVEPTYFVEEIWTSLNLSVSYKLICDLNPDVPIDILWDFWQKTKQDYFAPKHHTILAGHHWKVGDKFKPVVWALPGGRWTKGNKQIVIGPYIEVKKTWDLELTFDDLFYIGGKLYAYSSSHDALEYLAKNDGLMQADLLNWFNKPMVGQIICWNEQIEY
jgi:hypothetical protein